MWTPTTRAQHSRTGLRCGSDVTDAEWLLLSPFLPAPSPCRITCKTRDRLSASHNTLFFLEFICRVFCRRTRLTHDKIRDTYLLLLAERLLSGIGPSPANDQHGR